jgi:DNA-directed RNA polymerase specialized sigma24 family protein
VLRYPSPGNTIQFTAMTTTLAWVAVILLLPFVLLLWASESRQQRARRLRRMGWTQKRIAAHLNCSTSTVRRLLTT